MSSNISEQDKVRIKTEVPEAGGEGVEEPMIQVKEEETGAQGGFQGQGQDTVKLEMNVTE